MNIPITRVEFARKPDSGDTKEEKMGRVIEKVKVTNYLDIGMAQKKIIKENEIREVEIDAIVDTGATYLCLPPSVVSKLGLPLHKSVQIKTANGRAIRRTYKGVEIELKGRSFVMEVMENDEETPALIGYLVLEAMDFVVDPKTQAVIPNPANDGKWTADLYKMI